MARRLLLTESQLRVIIRKNLIETGLYDDILLESQRILMEDDDEDTWWNTFKALKMVFTVIAFVLGAAVVIIAMGTAIGATGGAAAAFIPALVAAMGELALPCTVTAVINLIFALVNHDKNKDTGEWENKPEWFGAFMSFLGCFGAALGTIKTLVGVGNTIVATGTLGRVLSNLSKMSLAEGMFAKVIKLFESGGMTWDIISPIKDSWTSLTKKNTAEPPQMAQVEEGFNRRNYKKLFEAGVSMDMKDKKTHMGNINNDDKNEANAVDLMSAQVKEQFGKDAEIKTIIKMTNRLKDACLNSKNKNSGSKFLKSFVSSVKKSKAKA
jgi:hypothetical protein